MVTNQSGVARGFFTEAVVDDVHAHLAAMLAAGGARIDAYYYCPHHPDGKVGGVRARPATAASPGRGLSTARCASSASIPRDRSSVGDRWLDVALARAVGARGILVRTGYGARRGSRRRTGRRLARRSPSWTTLTAGGRLNARRFSDLNRMLMLIARSVHPLPGEAERKERLLVARRRLREPPRARRRRSHRRRVHLRRGRARVARSAGADPEVRRDADGRRRRRQRRQQRRGARRPRAARGHRRRRSRRPPAARELSAAASIARTIVRARQYRTPVKTRILAGGVHSAQAAGRADRSRDRLAARRRRSAARSRASSRRRSTTATPCCCPTTARDS